MHITFEAFAVGAHLQSKNGDFSITGNTIADKGNKDIKMEIKSII